MMRVLVVEDDANVHKSIHDIIEMSFKDVKIDQAMDSKNFLAKIRKNPRQYDVVFYDLHFDEPHGREALMAIRREYPDFGAKVIVINETVQAVQSNEATRDLPYILKPFSLDTFADVAKKFGAVR